MAKKSDDAPKGIEDEITAFFKKVEKGTPGAILIEGTWVLFKTAPANDPPEGYHTPLKHA